MKEENTIEQLFKSSFEGFEVTPPAKVKVGIDERINKRNRIFLFWFLPIFVLISGIGAAAVRFHTSEKSLISNRSVGLYSKHTVGEPAGSTVLRTKGKVLIGSPLKRGVYFETLFQGIPTENQQFETIVRPQLPIFLFHSESPFAIWTHKRFVPAEMHYPIATASLNNQMRVVNKEKENRSQTKSPFAIWTHKRFVPAEMHYPITTASLNNQTRIANKEKENSSKYRTGVRSATGGKRIAKSGWKWTYAAPPKKSAEEIKKGTEKYTGSSNNSLADSDTETTLMGTQNTFKNAIQDPLIIPVTTVQPVIESATATTTVTDPRADTSTPLSEIKPADTLTAVSTSDTTVVNSSTVDPFKKPNMSVFRWMVSVYNGPVNGWNIIPADKQAVAEKGSYLLSLEIGRYFGSYAVHTGISYGKRTEAFYRDRDTTIITPASIDSVPIYNGADTIDWAIHYTSAGAYSKALTDKGMAIISSFGFPVYVSKEFGFGSSSWGMLADAGAIFNMYTVNYRSTGLSEAVLSRNKFGLNLSLRAHATYTWNRFVFSAGATGGYDFMPAVLFKGIDRKRYYLSPQVGVHWRF